MKDKDILIKVLESHVTQMQSALRLLIDATNGYLSAKSNDREAKLRKLNRALGVAERNESQPMMIAPVLMVCPVLYARVPIVLDSGAFERWPIQVFQSSDGGAEFRFGNNLLAFNPDGTWQANECMSAGLNPSLHGDFAAAWKDIGHHQRPASAYYQPDCDGWRAETAGWPKTDEQKRGMH